MEIKTNLSAINVLGQMGLTKPGAEKSAVINTNDSVVKSAATDNSFKKPVIETAKTGQAEEVKETIPAKTTSTSPSTAGIEGTPGPSTAIVSAQLQKLSQIGVEFLAKRAIPIPFAKHKKIDAESAASVLTSGNKGKISKLRAKIGKAAPMPINDFGDIGEISAFKGVGVMPAREKDLAGFLKYAGSIGLEFKTDDTKNVGEYGAYNLLTTGWGISGQNPKPVELVREGVSIMTLKPGENRSSQDLKKELEESWKAIDQIKEFKKPENYYKELSKPFMGMSFMEKHSYFDKMDRYCDRALENYQTITANAADKKELDEVTDIIENQEMITCYREPEFDPPDVELMMKKPIPDDASPTDKAEVIRNLRTQVTSGPTGNYYRERKAFVRDSFKLVQKSSKNGKDFLRLSKLYLEMIDNMGVGSSHSGDTYQFLFKKAKTAFGFITDQLKSKQDEAEAFVGLLKGSSVEKAKKRFQSIQMPVKTEDIATRVKVSHALIETKGFEDNYRTVLESAEPGQDPMELVDLMKRVRNHYGDDDSNSIKAFIDVNQSITMNGLTISEGNAALGILGSSLSIGVEGLKELAQPVRNEPFSNRKNLLTKLRSNYGKEKGVMRTDNEYVKYDKNALEDYRLVKSTLIKGESLEDAGDRFQMVFDNLGGYQNSPEVRDAYIIITESMKEGGSPLSSELIQKAVLKGKNQDEIRKILREGIKEAVKNSGNNPAKANGKIEQDEEKVIIGGVKLDKQKYENILKVLEKTNE